MSNNTTEFKIDTETVTLVRVNQRKWVLQDSEGTIIHTGNTKKGALIYIDSLVSAAKSLAARKTESESKLVGTKATPVKPSKKSAANDVKSAKVASKPTAKNAKATSKAKSKPAAVKTDKNVNRFKFGKTVNADIIMGYGKTVWGGILTLSNIHFEKSHYWMGTITNDEGVIVENTRLDYAINYLKVGPTLRSEKVVAQQQKAIAAAATATK